MFIDVLDKYSVPATLSLTEQSDGLMDTVAATSMPRSYESLLYNKVQSAALFIRLVYGDLLYYGKETENQTSDMAKSQDPPILQETMKGTRRRGRQKKRWKDNVKEWTRMGFGDFFDGIGRQGKVKMYCCHAICGAGFGYFLRASEDRERWKCIVATPSVVRGLEIFRASEDRERWKCIVATPSVVPRRPIKVKGLR